MDYFLSQINIFAFQLAPIFYQFVYMSVIATIVGLVVLLIRRVFQKYISPNWMSCIWLVFLLMLLIPTGIMSRFSIYNYIPDRILVINTQINRIPEISYREAYDNISSEYKVQSQTSQDQKKLQAMEQEKTKTYFASLFFDILFPYLWLITATLLIVSYLITYVIFCKRIGKKECQEERILQILEKAKQKLNIKKKVHIIEQKYINMPSLFGVFHIRILIQDSIKGLTDEQIEFIFLHELAHDKRKDNIWIVVTSLLKYFYIFNPVIWFLLKQMMKDVEMAADQIATKNLNEQEEKEYCKTLVEITNQGEFRFMAKSLCISSDKKTLKTRIQMVQLSDYFEKHKRQITVISIVLILILFITFCTTKVSNATETLNNDKLLPYANTYLGNASNVNAILELLPFAKHKQGISLQTTVQPYELTVKYNMSKQYKDFTYNNLVLFSFIPNLDIINYEFLNETMVVTRPECEEITSLTLNSAEEYINGENIFGTSANYRLIINKNGIKVFANADLAFQTFKRDYKKAIQEIQKQFHLFPLTNWNYQLYKTYSWQVITEDEDLRKQCSMVSRFLDIYENGYYTYKITEMYPMKPVAVQSQNMENTSMSLGTIANQILQQYFSYFYTEDTMPIQRLSNFVPIKDTIIAGDKKEFIAKVEYKVKSEYPAKQGMSAWGKQDHDNWVLNEVQVRIKQNEETTKQTIGTDTFTFTSYTLIEIGDNVSKEGLTEVAINEIPIKSY